MESYILAGVSLLILIPILYFLPIGFTFKGKVFVVFASLLIGVFGLVSAAVFPLWQTALILLLFVSSLAYLMSKRNLVWMYLQEDVEDIDPFSKEEEEEDNPLPDIKPSYTYIAISEKNQKGMPTDDVYQNQRNDIKQGLLEKLISQNEKNFSHVSIEKENEDLGEHELEELVLDVNIRNDGAAETQVTAQQDAEPVQQSENNEEVSQTVNLADVENNIEALVHNTEDVTDPDIEAIFQKTEAEVEELEAEQTKSEDSQQYISEIEHILETGEDELENKGSLDEESLPLVNLEEVLEPVEELEPDREIKLEKDPPQTWLNDEFEHEEMELIPNNTQESESSMKEKEKHKQAVEDNTMVKH